MDIDLAALLQGSDAMLIFSALGLGLLFGKLRIGSFELGSTPGVLLAALVLGSWGFDLNAQTESLGFMLFIFCVGIEAGPNFFSNFMQDGARFISIAVVMVVTAVLVTRVVSSLLDIDAGLAAGMLAGALTSTPTLVGAQDAVTQQLSHLGPEERSIIVSQISVGLAAGVEIVDALKQSGVVILFGGACIMLLPLTVGYLFGALVLKMNPVLLLGALTGAMTSTPALKVLNDMSGSSVPGLGYAGTYTFANVLLTLAGASIIML